MDEQSRESESGSTSPLDAVLARIGCREKGRLSGAESVAALDRCRARGAEDLADQ